MGWKHFEMSMSLIKLLEKLIVKANSQNKILSFSYSHFC